MTSEEIYMAYVAEQTTRALLDASDPDRRASVAVTISGDAELAFAALMILAEAMKPLLPTQTSEVKH